MMMTTRNLVVGLFACLTTTIALAQEQVKFRITYDLDRQKDLIDSTRINKRFLLDVGDSTALFYSPDQRAFDRAYNATKKQATDAASAIALMNQLLKKLPKGVKRETMRSTRSNGNFTEQNTIGATYYQYTEPLPQIEWKLTGRERSADGIHQEEAVGTCYGRTWQVWFATEYPMSLGPWLLGGLPGLIFEATDSEGLIHFTVAGLEQPAEKETIELSSRKVIKCKRKDFLKQRALYDSDRLGYLQQTSDIKIVKVLSPEGKDITHEKKASNALHLEKE